MAGRGRPKGSKNKDRLLQESPDPRAVPGHNSEGEVPKIATITDDERQKLHLSVHVPSYEAALEAKKEADKNFKTVCKMIKDEGGSLSAVKLTIQLRSDAGILSAKQDVEETLRVMRWVGLPVGTQAELFEEVDPRPLSEKAFTEGRISGMSGHDCVPPYTGDAEQEWIRGYHEGRAVNAEGLRRPEEPSVGDQELIRHDADGVILDDKDPFDDVLDDDEWNGELPSPTPRFDAAYEDGNE